MTARRLPLKAGAAVALLLAVLVVAIPARADGEAGIVVNWGDGRVTSQCVAFEGDSIDGAELLARAGFSVSEFSGLVCRIDDVGCTHSGTFNSCTCQCRTGSADCTYWSFYTRASGEPWRYAATGFRAQPLANGDMHAWQWLPAAGGAQPAPPALAFEDVCGHPPIAAATLPATVVAPSFPGSSTTPSPVAASATPSLPAAPSGVTASGPSAMATPGIPGAPATSSPTASPAPPASGADALAEPGGAATSTWTAFAAVCAVLAGAAWIAWRRRARRVD